MQAQCIMWNMYHIIYMKTESEIYGKSLLWYRKEN